MGASDVIIQDLKEDISKVEKKVDSVMAGIADLRVLVAGNYVSKTDFLEYQKIEEKRIVTLHQKVDANKEEERKYRWKLATIVATAVGIIVTITQCVIQIFV